MPTEASTSAASRSPLLVLHPDDDVAVLRADARVGADLGGLVACQAIPAGHKIALRAIPADAPIRKYGQIIGFATSAIAAGDHVHSHNLAMHDYRREAPVGGVAPFIPHPDPGARTFPGFLRAGGRVGTRNYIAVISSVNCSASTSKFVLQHFQDPKYRAAYPNVDGVIALTHKSGCCQQPGEPMDLLRRTLVGVARHPNVYGFIMVGLGCEGIQVPELWADKGLASPESAYFVIQESGGIRKTVDAAAVKVEALMAEANRARRTPQPVGRIVLGEQCGGSDAHSGITANPAVGVAGDELIRWGGSAVLAETPEIYGAEHLLRGRAVSEAVGDKLMACVRWWEEHARLHGATIDNNPTPGNKAGGLTTIYEKSLGAIAKAGQAPLAAVYRYAEGIDTPGLGFMDSPGYDPVSMTGLAAGGCTVGVFTTGRGSCFGCKPMPTIKIATTTGMYRFMEDDMDLNAGTVLDGEETVEEVGARIFEAIVAVAGGEPTKSEAQGLGDEEFAPWIIGPTF